MTNTKKINSLSFASNLTGKLSESVTKRINKYLNNPTVCGWDDIKGIIINQQGCVTIWQSIIANYPSFTKGGRITDVKGNIIKDWIEIPTVDMVTTSINNEVFKFNKN